MNALAFWRVVAAATTGHGHVAIGIPCQDAFAFEVVDDVVCAAVCDGAGSAPRSDVGAQLLSRQVVQGLAAVVRSDRGTSSLMEGWGRPLFEAVIEAARAEWLAQADAKGWAFEEGAATLVGAVVSRAGGWLFQIGDGVAAVRFADVTQPTLVSRPENGEYANETYFVTGAAWREHLRLQALPAGAATVVLMSDGAMPFAMNRGLDDFYGPFIDPVLRYLDGVSSEVGSQALGATLDDARIRNITADDKTLLIARWR